MRVRSVEPNRAIFVNRGKVMASASQAGKAAFRGACAALGLLCLLSHSAPAAAQQTNGGSTPENYISGQSQKQVPEQEKTGRLTPEQRRILLNNPRLFRDMTPEQRKLILDNFAAFRQLRPEERRHLLDNFRRWKSLPPPRQKELRENYRRFLQMSPDQRRRFLENYKLWQKMTPQQRSRILKVPPRQKPKAKKPPPER